MTAEIIELSMTLLKEKHWNHQPQYAPLKEEGQAFCNLLTV
jgi:hypothetical protein